MALVGASRVETMREGNTNVVVKTDMVVDTDTGLLLERKTILAAVPTADGNTAIVAGQRTSVVSIQVV